MPAPPHARSGGLPPPRAAAPPPARVASPSSSDASLSDDPLAAAPAFLGVLGGTRGAKKKLDYGQFGSTMMMGHKSDDDEFDEFDEFD